MPAALGGTRRLTSAQRPALPEQILQCHNATMRPIQPARAHNSNQQLFLMPTPDTARTLTGARGCVLADWTGAAIGSGNTRRVLVDDLQKSRSIAFELFLTDAGYGGEFIQIARATGGHFGETRIMENNIGRDPLTFGKFTATAAQRFPHFLAPGFNTGKRRCIDRFTRP